MSIFNIFRRKKEPEFPSHFGINESSEVAKEKGITDDFNKEIVIYKNGNEIKRYPYSKSFIKALEKVYEIPIVDAVEEEEDFEFDSYVNFGVVTYKK